MTHLKLKHFTLIILALFLGNMLLFGLPVQPSLEGKMAPDFIVKDQMGNNVQLSSFKGHYTYLYFWGTFCSPCIKSLKKFTEIYNAYPDMKIVTVCMDADKPKWNKILNNIRPAGTHCMDKGGMLGELGGIYTPDLNFPVTYLIDPSGKIIHVNKNIEQAVSIVNGASKDGHGAIFGNIEGEATASVITPYVPSTTPSPWKQSPAYSNQTRPQIPPSTMTTTSVPPQEQQTFTYTLPGDYNPYENNNTTTQPSAGNFASKIDNTGYVDVSKKRGIKNPITKYRINLGYFGAPFLQNFDHISHLGQLVGNKKPGYLYIMEFQNESEAVYALAQAKNMDFKDAHIEYTNDMAGFENNEEYHIAKVETIQKSNSVQQFSTPARIPVVGPTNNTTPRSPVITQPVKPEPVPSYLETKPEKKDGKTNKIVDGTTRRKSLRTNMPDKKISKTDEKIWSKDSKSYTASIIKKNTRINNKDMVLIPPTEIINNGKGSTDDIFYNPGHSEFGSGSDNIYYKNYQNENRPYQEPETHNKWQPLNYKKNNVDGNLNRREHKQYQDNRYKRQITPPAYQPRPEEPYQPGNFGVYNNNEVQQEPKYKLKSKGRLKNLLQKKNRRR